MNLKFKKLVGLIVLGFIGIYGFSQTHTEIKKAEKMPAIDGLIDPDWNEYGFRPLLNILAGSTTTNVDFSARYSVAWDSENIYFVVEVSDDKKINDSPEAWKDDAVEIYIDINNDKLSSYGPTDYQYTFAWNDPALYANGPTENIEYVLKNTALGYVLEVKFPWHTLGLSNAKEGIKLGFDVHVHDDDDGGDRDNKLAWFAVIDQSWNNPSLFATAELIGAGGITLFSAKKPNISVSHGFFEKPFDVTISSVVEGMEIYYTLDGTDPTVSKTAFVKAAPANVRIDPTVTDKRGKTPAVVLRAAAIKTGYDFSEVLTRSYIFIDQVKNQTANPGHDWPNYNVNSQILQYPMNQAVTNSSAYSNLIDDALLQIPTISIVTDNSNLFDSNKGIYVNANNDGSEWERPASIELINPDGSKGFQVDAGIRIRGGYSRNPFFRKHAFRLFFRSEYGESKLDYPMFEDEGAKSFDKLDLRCSQNFSWSKGGEEAPYCTFNRDVFSRDLQREMGWPYTRSRYYHLYLNGMYWGLFQSQERSEARFASEYLGGNVEDYDVVRYGEATDGNLDSWREVWDICQQGFSMKNYYKIQGLDENGKRDPSMKVMVDIDNLIDYMHVIFYTGNYDAPVSAWGGNKSINNFYCIYNRNNNDEGFKFFAHDNESTLLIDNINQNYNWHPCIGINQNRVNLGNLNDNNRMAISDFGRFNPQWLHFRLTKNEEYRTRFADRSYELYYNNGLLTPEKTAPLFINRANAIDMAVIAESARWGDVGGYVFTKNKDWDIQIQRTVNEYFPRRSAIVMKQLQDENLLPVLEAPVFKASGKIIVEESIKVASGSTITIENPKSLGAIKYTVDGTDPRNVGGAVSSSAIDGSNLANLSLLKTSIIKARIFNNNGWSALHTLKIIVDKKINELQITEIYYNPIGAFDLFGNESEFIELYNRGNTPIILTASYFEGINYAFINETTLNPGAYLTLASNAYTFNLKYKFQPYGEYGGKLSNGGERITLFSPSGDTIVSVKYNDKEPWPTAADGSGFSLVPDTDQLNVDWNDGTNWRASSVVGGTPNAKDTKVVVPAVFVNEILSNTDAPSVDAIELYNPNNYEVNIGNWFLSDRKDTAKWRIPEGTIIPANGYVVFYEGHYVGSTLNFSANEFGSKFSLNSHGDEAYVFSANNLGELTGYVHGFDFGDSDVGVSYGRHIISTGNDHFVPMSSLTFGSKNSYPLVGPLVINKIMYHPVENEFEFLELVNITNKDVPLYEETSLEPWKVSGIDFAFPRNTVAKPGESIYIVESNLNPDDFRFRYEVDEAVPVFNFEGNLDNGGETLILYKSAPTYIDSNKVKQPFVRVDKVNYNDNAAWPDADGNGYTLHRSSPDLYGNDPANWLAVPQGISISTFSLKVGVEGVFYEFQLKASGGVDPLVWNIKTGSLPTGISLNSTLGIIGGTTMQVGEFDLVVEVVDQQGLSAEAKLVLTINKNTLPIAFNDTVSTNENLNVSVDVLKNDVDTDGDALVWLLSLKTLPLNGKAVVNNDKTVTYIPNTGFSGIDYFTYQISDYSGSTNANVLINVREEFVSESIDVRITQSTDDAEENIESGQLWDSSSDLEFTYDVNPGGNQIVGLRFQDIDVPQGAEITKAYIQFKTDEISDVETSLVIKGEAVDQSLTFSGNYSISSRQLTSSSVTWIPSPWLSEGEISEKQKTPNLDKIIQEIVNRSGWSNGNALAFVVSGSGTRVAESFEGDAAGAALLHIEYQVIAGEATLPVAVAKYSNETKLHSVVTLDGSESYSSDKRGLNYFWSLKSIPNGSNAKLSNQYALSPSFELDAFGLYEITLIVNNGVKSSSETNVIITVNNGVPIANAGSDKERIVGSEVMLNGSKSVDPEGEALSFKWEIIKQPSGSNIKLDNANIVNPKFIPQLTGEYILSLTVSDGYVMSIADEVTITVSENQVPIAIAGDDFSVYKDAIVGLDAGSSYDPEGVSLTYEWKIISTPQGSSVVLSSLTNKKPTFRVDLEGDYIFELIVSDGINVSMSDSIVVSVITNLVPFANAGSNQNVKQGDKVYLNASSSSDPEGFAIKYRWEFVTIPAGSNAKIDDAYAAIASFVADKSGVYKVELFVSDDINVARDEVQIVADTKTNVHEIVLNSKMKVYPNPFSGRLFVDIDSVNNEKLTFELFSIAGSLIEKVQIYVKKDRQIELQFNKQNIKNGMYLLRVKTEDKKPQVVRISYNNNLK